MYCCK